MALTSTVLSTTSRSIFSSSGSNAITSMYFCNTGNVAVHFNIFAVPNGYSISNTRLIYCEVPITPLDTYVIDTERLMLDDGDAIYASLTAITDQLITGLSDTGWGFADVGAVFWAQDRTEYIVVGTGGVVAISQDGIDWEYKNGAVLLGWPAGSRVTDVTRLNLKRYLMVGENGWIASSIDGTSWTGQTGLTNTVWGTNNVNAATTNGSVFIAVGDNGSVATSPDGLTWDFQVNLSATGWGTSNIYAVIWDGNNFVIGGESGKLATSPDGVAWTYNDALATNPAWGAATRITSISYSGSQVTGYMVVSADNGKSAISSNLTSWTYESSMADLGATGINSVTFKVNFGFFAIDTTGAVYVRSTSGNWSKYSYLQAQPWSAFPGTDILWNAPRSEFIAVGYGARVATSVDGIIWDNHTESPTTEVIVPDVVATVSSISI